MLIQLEPDKFLFDPHSTAHIASQITNSRRRGYHLSRPRSCRVALPINRCNELSLKGVPDHLRVSKISDLRGSGVSGLLEDGVREGTPLVGGGEDDITIEFVDD